MSFSHLSKGSLDRSAPPLLLGVLLLQGQVSWGSDSSAVPEDSSPFCPRQSFSEDMISAVTSLVQFDSSKGALGNLLSFRLHNTELQTFPCWCMAPPVGWQMCPPLGPTLGAHAGNPSGPCILPLSTLAPQHSWTFHVGGWVNGSFLPSIWSIHHRRAQHPSIIQLPRLRGSLHLPTLWWQ